MAEQVTIPISVFEIQIAYVRPVLKLWLDRAALVQKLFDAFQGWNLNVDDVEAVTTGKPSDQGVKFKLPSQKITFFFGPAGCKFTKEAATWADADNTLSVLIAALNVLTHDGGVGLGKKSTSLSLHIQPKNVPFRELLWPFLSPAVAHLEDTKAEAMAYVIRWKGRRVTLDGSASLANGVFAQLEREFESTVSFDEIRTAIFNDEVKLLNLLCVEEVES